MNLTIETGVSAITVFLQGLLSVFSPCVLPLIPLYISYLSGGATGSAGGMRRGLCLPCAGTGKGISPTKGPGS